MKPFFVTIALTALWLSLSPAALPADTSPAPHRADTVSNSLLLPDLSVMPNQEAEEAANRFSDHLDTLRHNVIMQLKRPNLGVEQKASLYRFAADLRVYEAVDIMINDIAFVDERRSRPAIPAAPLPLGVGGPTAQAMLSTYGLPAFREIMEVMSDRKQDVPSVAANTDAYAWVLWAIEGKRYAILRLQDRLTLEKSPKVQAQYRMVINRLEAYPKDE